MVHMQCESIAATICLLCGVIAHVLEFSEQQASSRNQSLMRVIPTSASQAMKRSQPYRKCKKVPRADLESLLRPMKDPRPSAPAILDRKSTLAFQRRRKSQAENGTLGFLQRRPDQNHVYRLTFYFSCPRWLEARETFLLRVKYTEISNRVKFHNVLKIGSFSGEDQVQIRDETTIDYEGVMHSTLQHHHRDPATGILHICDYTYRAFIEGEVYFESMTALVAQPADQNSYFQPTIIEQCIHYERHDTSTEVCVAQDQSSTCDIERISTTYVPE